MQASGSGVLVEEAEGGSFCTFFPEIPKDGLSRSVGVPSHDKTVFVLSQRSPETNHCFSSLVGSLQARSCHKVLHSLEPFRDVLSFLVLEFSLGSQGGP